MNNTACLFQVEKCGGAVGVENFLSFFFLLFFFLKHSKIKWETEATETAISSESCHSRKDMKSKVNDTLLSNLRVSLISTSPILLSTVLSYHSIPSFLMMTAKPHILSAVRHHVDHEFSAQCDDYEPRLETGSSQKCWESCERWIHSICQVEHKLKFTLMFWMRLWYTLDVGQLALTVVRWDRILHFMFV